MLQIRKIAPYILQGIVAGIIIGVIVIFFGRYYGEDPNGVGPGAKKQPSVEVIQATDNKSTPGNGSGPVSYANAVNATAPAVANIYTTKIVTQRLHPLFDDPFFQRFFGGTTTTPRQRLENSLGSAVIISKQGYLLTNYHVIEGADEIQVALHDGRTAEASIVGSDPESDIAVLYIDLQNLPVITLGESRTLSVGDVVLAIGNPYGVGQTVTMGIVSATGRNQLGISTYENFIQTDAAINPGNSGGALVNAYGHLVGINTAIFSRSGGSQGIGFAIPIHLARKIMEQIIEHGYAIRGWLGIEAQDLTPALAESFGLQNISGVVVAGILRGSPADKAGLNPGDIITHVDGQTANSAREIINLVADTAPGSKVTLKCLRDKEAVEISVTIGKRPNPEKAIK